MELGISGISWSTPGRCEGSFWEFLGSKTSANSVYSGGMEGIALTDTVDVERAESRAAVMPVTSMTEYKMISSRLGLIHLVGRIAGRRERGQGREDGSVGGGIGEVVGEGSKGGDDLETGWK